MLTGAELAEFLARCRVVNAHHEAGHAVAAVLRGGEVEHMLIGDPSDAGMVDAEHELVGRTRHRSGSWDRPFIAFAGQWAQWRIETEDGEAEDMDLWAWLDTQAFMEAGEGDYMQMDYDNLSGVQIEVWARELEEYWPAIVAVAAVALACDPVNTGVIEAIIDGQPA